MTVVDQDFKRTITIGRPEVLAKQAIAALKAPGVTRVLFVREVGRNQRCPCNSGKKFKKCCGSLTEK